MQVCKLVTCYVQIMIWWFGKKQNKTPSITMCWEYKLLGFCCFYFEIHFNTSVKYHVPVQCAAILLGLTDSDGVIDVNSR